MKLFQSLFCVLNEKGTVIQWKFTKTESTAELENVFLQLSQRFKAQNIVLDGIYLDNCCKWAQFLGKYFPDVCVKLDIFHAVQRFVRKIPKRSKHSSESAKEYGLVFRQLGDIGKHLSSPTPSPTIILKNLEKFCPKWDLAKTSAGTSVLTKEMLKEIRNIKIHINKGCLSDIPVGCGTNRNERLHRDLTKIVTTNRIGLPLLYTKMFRMFYRLAQENEKGISPIEEMTAEKRTGAQREESRTNLEYFGVEKSLEDIDENELQKETRKVRGLETFSRQDIDGIFNSIATLQNNIERI